MIDAKLLQSFMSDIEWLRTFSSTPASGTGASQKANSAEYDPFEEVLARAMGVVEAAQSEGNSSISDASSALQLLQADLLNTWLNPGSNQGSQGRYVTTEDIDKLFPELAALNSILG